MKKRYLVVLVAMCILGMCIACDDTPTDGGGGSGGGGGGGGGWSDGDGSSALRPPAWMIGTWEVTVSATVKSTYTVSSENLVIVTDEGGTLFTLDFSGIEATAGASVTEDAQATTYAVGWARVPKTQTFTFTKGAGDPGVISSISINTDGHVDNYPTVVKK